MRGARSIHDAFRSANRERVNWRNRRAAPTDLSSSHCQFGFRQITAIPDRFPTLRGRGLGGAYVVDLAKVLAKFRARARHQTARCRASAQQQPRRPRIRRAGREICSSFCGQITSEARHECASCNGRPIKVLSPARKWTRNVGPLRQLQMFSPALATVRRSVSTRIPACPMGKCSSICCVFGRNQMRGDEYSAQQIVGAVIVGIQGVAQVERQANRRGRDGFGAHQLNGFDNRTR